MQPYTSSLQKLVKKGVAGKSRQHYHKRGTLKEQNITRIDYVFIRSDNDNYEATVLTMSRRKAIYGAIQAIKRFIVEIVENGLRTAILP
eukprot:6456442-Amphidinium_carterae.1